MKNRLYFFIIFFVAFLQLQSLEAIKATVLNDQYEAMVNDIQTFKASRLFVLGNKEVRVK